MGIERAGLREMELRAEKLGAAASQWLRLFSNFIEVYRYRSLVWALVVRHLSIRYRGSVLGFLWTFLNPLCLMLVYTLVFKYYIRFDQVNNYTIFLFCGLLPWLWVQSSLIEGSSSVVGSGHLITKSMFPAQILPTVAVLINLVNFALSLPLLFIFMLIAQMELHWTLLALPLLVIIQFFFLVGLSWVLGALNVHFRDVQHIVGNLLTFLFFLCPILYPFEQVPERFRFTLELNPFALYTMCYHALVLEGILPSAGDLLLLGLYAIAALALGDIVFNRYRESFAELL